MSDGLAFLVRSAREFRRGGYVFTGFHWPVLAGRLAYRLPGSEFRQVFEAGAITAGPFDTLPTSTTDYPAYANAVRWRGSSADALLGLARRYDRVVLDATNVDLRGRVNASLIGPNERPTTRMAGGGGAADIAAAAGELVLLHGGDDPTRIQATVEHVTAAPRPTTTVILHCRWGVLRLGASPALLERAERADRFAAHLRRLNVPVDDATPVQPATAEELAHARAVLIEAAQRGYRVARRELEQED